MILIITRPVWNYGRNLWLQELRRNLSPQVVLLSFPSDEISLSDERKARVLLSKKPYQNFFSKIGRKKVILFTSPTSVEAFYKLCKKKFFLPGNGNGLLNERLSANNIDKIAIGAIGEGTATKICERLLLPSSNNEYFRTRDLRKILYLKREGSGQRWAEEFSERIRSNFVVLIEGKGNSDTLAHSLKANSSKVFRIGMYKRRNLINSVTSVSLLEKISFLKKNFPKSTDNKQCISIVISSTTALSKLGSLIKRLHDGERLNIISHHDKILSQVKKIHVSIPCIRVKSLNPICISEEINHLL